MSALAIFDLDGTLIDSRPDIAAALNHALARVGRPSVPPAEIERMIGDGVRRLCERALGPDHLALTDALAAAYRARYGEHLVDRTALYPGIAALLDASAGLRKVIATNKPGPWARAIVAALGVGHHFELVLGEDEAAARKPDRAVVDRVLAATGAAPGRALVIGDSTVDIALARNAGLPVCAVGWGYADPAALRAAAPDHLVEDAGALGRLLAGLERA